MDRRSIPYARIHGIKMDRSGISEVLPHRDQALCLDGVIQFQAESAKLVSVRLLQEGSNEFKGHFPGTRILPGHWMIEYCLLSFGLLHFGLHEEKISLPAPRSIEGLQFLRKVSANELLTINVSLIGYEQTKHSPMAAVFSAFIENERGKKVLTLSRAHCVNLK